MVAKVESDTPDPFDDLGDHYNRPEDFLGSTEKSVTYDSNSKIWKITVVGGKLQKTPTGEQNGSNWQREGLLLLLEEWRDMHSSSSVPREFVLGSLYGLVSGDQKRDVTIQPADGAVHISVYQDFHGRAGFTPGVEDLGVYVGLRKKDQLNGNGYMSDVLVRDESEPVDGVIDDMWVGGDNVLPKGIFDGSTTRPPFRTSPNPVIVFDGRRGGQRRQPHITIHITPVTS